MKHLIILFLFISLSVFPQSKIIKGKILDFETKLPLPKANIYFQENKKIGTVSDEDGNFAIRY